jgi:glycosyltransferase involved in cell wall biosynthesis
VDPELSIVAPCFNEADGLAEFVRRCIQACRGTGLSFEIVLVNDGSRDGTWEVMRELAAGRPGLVCVNLSRNHGHQLALTAGLSVCRGERVLIIDADLQDPPELLPAMLERLAEGFDVVYAQRRRRAGETRFKLWTAAAFYRLFERLSDHPLPRDTGDFRLMSRRALDVLLSMPERKRFVRGMVSWIGFRQTAILYDRQARFAGTTQYPFRKMARFALDAITGFSTRPLTWIALAGLAGSLLCGAGLAAALVAWSLGAAPGLLVASLALALLACVQLAAIGVLGFYLGRMYEQVQGRPLFILESIVRSEDQPVAGEGGPLVVVRPVAPVGTPARSGA